MTITYLTGNIDWVGLDISTGRGPSRTEFQRLALDC